MKTQKNLYTLLALVMLLTAPFVDMLAQDDASRTLRGQRETEQGVIVNWYEGGSKLEALLVLDEVAVYLKPQAQRQRQETDETIIEQGDLIRRFHPQARLTQKKSLSLLFLKRPAPVFKSQFLETLAPLRQHPDVKLVCPVIYLIFDPHKVPEPIVPLWLSGKISVQFPAGASEERIRAIEAEYGLARVERSTLVPNLIYYREDDVWKLFDIVNRLSESGQVLHAEPEMVGKYELRGAVPYDTLFQTQWALQNTGQAGGAAGEDLNITPVWEHYRGTPAQIIAIVDDGVDIQHADLAPNVLPVRNKSWNYIEQTDDPTPPVTEPDHNHGTAVAGIASAYGFHNTTGLCGVAPAAGLVAYRVPPGSLDFHQNIGAAFVRDNTISVYNNSWGGGYTHFILSKLALEIQVGMETSIQQGRGGRGGIFVFAGGNDAVEGGNANYDGHLTTRYTIGVAASGNQGQQSAYSNPGANILVNAPSSRIGSREEDGDITGITTTDRTGAPGYNTGEYSFYFSGTSAAAPHVSGVIALMLQANPNLYWHEVQQILARTAEQNDPSDSDWTTNEAGYHINHKYGFGRVDAAAAVNAAHSWTTVAPSLSFANLSSTVNETIPEPGSVPDTSAAGVRNIIYVPENQAVDVAEVTLTAANHPNWSDLEVTLTSPAGTASVLAEQHDAASVFGDFDHWQFSSVRHLGELSRGRWTLTVKDLNFNNYTGTFQSWGLNLYGRPAAETAGSFALTYGESGDEVANAIQHTADGGFIVVGKKGSDLWILKLDSSGQWDQDNPQTWQKTYGGSGDEEGWGVQQTDDDGDGQHDDGFLVAGTTNSFGSQEYDVWVLKLDQNGNVGASYPNTWQKRYGGAGVDAAYALQQTDDDGDGRQDDGFIIAGKTNSFGYHSENDDMWLIKLDASGNVGTSYPNTWQKRYGRYVQGFSYQVDRAYAVRQTQDRGYIVAGENVAVQNQREFCVLRLDGTGNVAWRREDRGSEDASARSLQETADGGYVAAGSSGDDLWLLKLDDAVDSDGKQGRLVWQQLYASPNGADIEAASAIRETGDSGYIVAGKHQQNAWVLKLDSLGSAAW